MTESTAAKAAKAVKKATTRTTAKRATTPATKQASAKTVRPTAKAAKPGKPAAKPAAPKTDKPKKPKLVRDSFTMPEDEYALLSTVKKACVAAGVDIKKSELLRIGIALLATMDTKAIKASQLRLTPLKAGRPKKK